jgi:hypothetical protein
MESGWVRPGELDSGDVIEAPGQGRVRVERVLLGQGGFILEVSTLDSDDDADLERLVMASATTVRRMDRRGREQPRG